MVKKIILCLVLALLTLALGCGALRSKQEGDGPNQLKKSPCAELKQSRRA